MVRGEISIRRGHLLGVLLANAVLWVAAMLMIGPVKLGGPAAIALISIASLFPRSSRGS